MRITFLAASAVLGGAERVLLEMVGALARQGCLPSVVCPDHGPLVEQLRQRVLASFHLGPHDWFWRRSNLP